MTVEKQVSYAGNNLMAFSVSNSGVLAYRSGSDPNTHLVWFDRQGRPMGSISPPGDYRCPELSPDGKRVAVERSDPQSKTYDIFLIELSEGVTSRFTFDPANNSNAAWSPDGRRILFSSDKKGHKDIYQKTASGATADELVFQSNEHKNIDQWSKDGRYVVYTGSTPSTKNDLWVMPMFGDRKPSPFLQTPANEVQGQISPDGRWMAYASNETGTLEVYVQSFLRSGGKWQISMGGGAQPRWRRDGKELFYIANDKRLMAVKVNADSSTFRFGVIKALFETGVTGLTNARNHYAVTADGQRFLINTIFEQATYSPITVVLNWNAGLKR